MKKIAVIMMLAGMMGMGNWGVQAAPLESGATEIGSAGLNKFTLQTLPVFRWLVIGESTTHSVLPKLQQKNLLIEQDTFAYDPQGVLINASKLLGPGIEGDTGLRIMSLGFGKDRRLESVTMLVERGWKDKNVGPLCDRMQARYGAHAHPMVIQDGRGEATDTYTLYDLGRFVVEVAVPQNGSFASVIFATKDLYKKMKRADRTDELLLPRLSN